VDTKLALLENWKLDEPHLTEKVVLKRDTGDRTRPFKEVVITTKEITRLAAQEEVGFTEMVNPMVEVLAHLEEAQMLVVHSIKAMTGLISALNVLKAHTVVSEVPVEAT
jgi:hypothetical protein